MGFAEIVMGRITSERACVITPGVFWSSWLDNDMWIGCTKWVKIQTDIKDY